MRFLLVLAVGISLLTAVPTMANEAEDEAAIRAATKQANDAFNRHDIDAHVAVYADPFVGFQGKVDQATHRENHSELWAREPDRHDELVDEGEVTFLTPDLAVHTFEVEMNGRLDEDGNELPPGKREVGRVYAKRDGKWLTVATFGRPVEE